MRFWLTFVVAACALGAAAWYYAAPPERSAEAATPALGEAVAVEAAPVSVGTVIEDLRAVGTLRPNEAVAVAPEIAGRAIDHDHAGRSVLQIDHLPPPSSRRPLVEYDAAGPLIKLARAASWMWGRAVALTSVRRARTTGSAPTARPRRARSRAPASPAAADRPGA